MSEVIGPHVLEETSETAELYVNGSRKGDFPIWECKYCSWSGIHPKHSSVNLRIQKDCEDVEWRETDTLTLEQ